MKSPLCQTHQCATRPVEMIDDPALAQQFTMNGTVPVLDWFLGREMHATVGDDGGGGGEADGDPHKSCKPGAAEPPPPPPPPGDDHGDGGGESSGVPVWGPELVAEYLKQYTAVNAMQWGYRGLMLASTAQAELEGAVPAGSWDSFHVDRQGSSLGRTTTLATVKVEESYPGATILHCAAFASYPVRRSRSRSRR